MPVSHPHRCVFVHIPKTAGTSIEKALGIFGDWRHEDRDILFGQSAMRLDGQPLSSPYLQHLRASELARLVPQAMADYLTFTVVRNPWDKLVSAYANKDVHLCRFAQAQGVTLQDTDFATFVARSAEIDHAHLRPQHGFLCDAGGRLLVDVVARWETLARDFADICRRLDVEIELPRENTSARSAYRDYYDGTTRKLVEQRYAEDIDAFAYRF